VGDGNRLWETGNWEGFWDSSLANDGDLAKQESMKGRWSLMSASLDASGSSTREESRTTDSGCRRTAQKSSVNLRREDVEVIAG
jgi:hypothetical protein